MVFSLKAIFFIFRLRLSNDDLYKNNEDIKLGSFEEIRDAFAQVAKAPVALEGATIEVVE